jgi:hypothetical protein
MGLHHGAEGQATRLPQGRERLRRRGAVSRAAAMSEVSLYPAVKRFLEAAGFDVKGEVKGCDIVAVRLEEPRTLTIVEMKLGFTLDLLLPRRTGSAWRTRYGSPCPRRGAVATGIRASTAFAGCSASACWWSAPDATGSRCSPSPRRTGRAGISPDARDCLANMGSGAAIPRREALPVNR